MSSWSTIQDISDPDGQIRAANARAAGWWQEEGDDARFEGFVLSRIADVLTLRKRLIASDGDWERRIGGSTAVGHARKIARLCGPLLAALEPSEVESTLAGVPNDV